LVQDSPVAVSVSGDQGHPRCDAIGRTPQANVLAGDPQLTRGARLSAEKQTAEFAFAAPEQTGDSDRLAAANAEADIADGRS
jgi:hypothetical protein